MRFSVNIDVPFASRELLRLLRCEGGLPTDGARGGAALLTQPDRYGTVLAFRSDVEMRHGHRTRKSVTGDRPGDDPRARVIGKISLSCGRGLDGRHLLRAGNLYGEGYGRSLRQSWLPPSTVEQRTWRISYEPSRLVKSDPISDTAKFGRATCADADS